MSNEKIYWTMKNGNKIDVDQMTESHLRNTLKMIIRNSDKYINDEYEKARDKAIKNQKDLTPFCDDRLWK